MSPTTVAAIVFPTAGRPVSARSRRFAFDMFFRFPST